MLERMNSLLIAFSDREANCNNRQVGAPYIHKSSPRGIHKYLLEAQHSRAQTIQEVPGMH